MGFPISSAKFFGMVKDALQLSDDCKRVEIVLEAGGLATVRCEVFVRKEQAEHLASVLQSFELVLIDKA